MFAKLWVSSHAVMQRERDRERQRERKREREITRTYVTLKHT